MGRGIGGVVLDQGLALFLSSSRALLDSITAVGILLEGLC